MYGRAYSALRFTPGLLSDEFNRRALYHGYNPLPRQRMIVHYQNPYHFSLHCLSSLLIEALKHTRRLLGKPTLIKVGRDDKLANPRNQSSLAGVQESVPLAMLHSKGSGWQTDEFSEAPTKVTLI
jgi:hypothetical protein